MSVGISQRRAALPWGALLLALVLAVPATAGELMLLVHGHFGTRADWTRSRVVPKLTDAGWHDGGLLAQGPVQVVDAPRVFYVVELPSLAPLQVQAGVLADRIYDLREVRQGDHLIVVGHSAGGVVARLVMVQQPQVRVDALITIAAPHLGTPLASAGAELGRGLVGSLPYVGQSATVAELQRLYQELGDSGPGSLLHWLNHQPHPDALYVSVVRPEDPTRMSFDPLVPSWSQSLAAVPALSGRARIEQVPGLHGLGPNDADWLMEFLSKPGV